jgi:hypothetical protein
MRLALDAHAARATLVRGRKLLDSSLGMSDGRAPQPDDGFQIARRPGALRPEFSFSCDPAPTS